MRDDESDDPGVTIRCGRRPEVSVRLHDRYVPDRLGVGFAVAVNAAGLRACAGIEVWDWDDPLPAFVNRLAEEYGGWSGERSWRSEHLAVQARAHSGGHVELTWELSAEGAGWRASVPTWLEAGEQMRALAADLDAFLSRPDPT